MDRLKCRTHDLIIKDDRIISPLRGCVALGNLFFYNRHIPSGLMQSVHESYDYSALSDIINLTTPKGGYDYRMKSRQKLTPKG